MKFFEFHFNPKLAKKKDTIFDTFCFLPEKKEEKNLGNLFIAGELKNVLPKTKNLLNILAEIIKNEFYKTPQKEPQKALKEALVKANEFLTKELKKENVSWLGNLNFVVISLTSDFSINFSKIGNFKILLLREKEIYDLGENIEPSSPLKVFPNLVEGKLQEKDKIVVISPEVFSVFEKEEILQDIIEIKKPKLIKKIFKQKKKALEEIFGACLLIILEKKRFLFKKIYLPKISFTKNLFPQSLVLQEKFKKSLIGILILIILLILGWLIFK